MSRPIFIIQAVLQFLVGLSAAISGALLTVVPSGRLLQAPVDMLRGSPFADFLIPGLILFLVNGAGQLVACVLSYRMHRWSGYAGAVFGFGLMIWIFVQVNMIGGGHILQYGYFAVGVVETALAFLMQSSLANERRQEQR